MKDCIGNDLEIFDDVIVISAGNTYYGYVCAFHTDTAACSPLCGVINYDGGKLSWLFSIEIIKDKGKVYNFPVVAPSALKEKPCDLCGKMNDIGVSKCWNCESVIK